MGRSGCQPLHPWTDTEKANSSHQNNPWSFIPTVPCTITEGQHEWEDTTSRKRLRNSLVCTQYSTNLVKKVSWTFSFSKRAIAESICILNLFIYLLHLQIHCQRIQHVTDLTLLLLLSLLTDKGISQNRAGKWTSLPGTSIFSGHPVSVMEFHFWKTVKKGEIFLRASSIKGGSGKILGRQWALLLCSSYLMKIRSTKEVFLWKWICFIVAIARARKPLSHWSPELDSLWLS